MTARAMLPKVFLVSSFVLCSGCYAPGADVALSPAAEGDWLGKIAICPFAQGGSLPNAGTVTTHALEAALLARGTRIVPFSRVEEALLLDVDEDGRMLEDEIWTRQALERVRVETGARAVLVGAVTNSWFHVGELPPYQIDCAFRILDTRSGEILAAGNATEDGASPESAARQLARRILERLQPSSESSAQAR